jgi:Domain of unknown function (DUF4249)
VKLISIDLKFRMPSLSRRYLTSLVILILAGCVEEYNPALKPEDTDILVVDGFVNTVANLASVKLTVASPMYGPEKPLPETGATVTLENKAGDKIPLKNNGDGTYSIASSEINGADEYRLHIQRSSDREYYSTYVESIQAQSVIDNVKYEIIDNNVHVYVDAHDPSLTAKYFLWEIEEVWEYASSFPSYFKVVGKDIVRRQPDDGIGICWNTAGSPKVLIYNAEKQSAPVVNHFEVAVVASQSQKLSRRYSINVRQRVLSQDAYKYWLQLKETTEHIGGLFDPQLSSVIGNMKSNDGVPVIGYFGSGDVVEKRIFISHEELPEKFGDMSEIPMCSFSTDMILIPGFRLELVTEKTLLIEYDSPSRGYYTADPFCVDCRMQGGTTRRPPYW